MRIPTARYSRRTMSANSRTRPGVAHRRHTQGFAPLREAGKRATGEDVVAEMVARVGGNCNRNAEPGFLGEALQLVVPGRHPGSSRACTLKWVRCFSSTTTLVADLLIAPAPSTTAPSGARLDDGVEHQADLLLERQPPEQVVDARLDVEAGVLEGVHPPVAVEVAVAHPVVAGRPGPARCRGRGRVPCCRWMPWCPSLSWSPPSMGGQVVAVRHDVCCRAQAAAHVVGLRARTSLADDAGAELLDADDRAAAPSRRRGC